MSFQTSSLSVDGQEVSQAMERYSGLAAFSLGGVEKPRLIIAPYGLTGDFDQPLDLFAGFSSSFVEVSAPDLRAHGLTRYAGAPNDRTREQLADDVLALVQGFLGDVTTVDATR